MVNKAKAPHTDPSAAEGKKKRPLAAPPQPAATPEGAVDDSIGEALGSEALQQLAVALQTGQFSTLDEAIGFLVDGIVGKVDGDPARREELKQYLQLLIDTDPMLKDVLEQAISLKS